VALVLIILPFISFNHAGMDLRPANGLGVIYFKQQSRIATISCELPQFAHFWRSAGEVIL